MPNTILLKRGTTEPTAGVLSVGELAIDTTNGNTYTKLDDGTVSLLGSRASKVEIPVRNETGSTIPAGSAVYITGASGNKPLISLAQANSEMTSSKTLGLTTTSILNGHNGYVILFGSLDKIDTLAYSAGQALWLSATVAGGLVTTPPSQPNHSVFIGIVITSANNGKIEVKIANGFELEELHNVSITNANNNDILSYETSTGLWKNKSFSTLGLATTSLLENTISSSTVSKYFAPAWQGGSIGTGSSALNVFGNQRVIAPTSAVGVALRNHPISQNVRGVNPDNGAVNFSKRIVWGFRLIRYSFGTTDANSVCRAVLGKTGSVGDPTVKSIGIFFTGTSVLKLIVHDGTTLRTIDTTFTPIHLQGFDCLIISDGAGNVSLSVNDAIVATSSNGPVGNGTSTPDHRIEAENIAVLTGSPMGVYYSNHTIITSV
jgi:hypothetical protein